MCFVLASFGIFDIMPLCDVFCSLVYEYAYRRMLLLIFVQSKDPRFHALPLASQRVATFAETVNELVYDVLISKVRQCLSNVSHMPIWASAEETSAFPLPSFSAYPQSYVTSVGEYLLTLPQQLEPLIEGIASDDANADEAQIFATEWMFKVTTILHNVFAIFVEVFTV